MSNHPIVHVELWNTDPDAAAKFYSEVFGWEIQRTPMPGDMPGEYIQFSAGNTDMGGAFPQAGPMPDGQEMKPGPMVYIGTDDIEASLSKVKAAGGTVLNAGMEIPGFGSMATFRDTSGNVVSLWKSANPGG
ncbi:MAG: VOC family protein [Anaerolineales bacterium]